MPTTRTSRPSTSCARPATRPSASVVRPRADDAAHRLVSGAWRPSDVQGALQSAIHGQPGRQFALYAQMLQRWARLGAVEGTRRLALTGLDWDLLPGPDGNETVRRWCEQTLRNLPSFDAALVHLATGSAYGIAVTELVWQGGILQDLVPVPFGRLYSSADEPWRLRVRLDDHEGPALDTQPWKWIVHRPDPLSGGLFEGGLLRRSALLYLAHSLSFKDWLVYSQVAGTPLRVARFEQSVDESDKRRLLEMLQRLGTDAVAAVSKNVELDFVQPASGATPYGELQAYCNREVTILWLGQHLTTDIVGEGSRAAAEIHDRVREDLLVHDLHQERCTLERDLLTPLVRQAFGAQVAVPRFRRSLVQAGDSRTLTETLGRAVRELGLGVPRRWAHRALGIPEAQPGEPVLQSGATR